LREATDEAQQRRPLDRFLEESVGPEIAHQLGVVGGMNSPPPPDRDQWNARPSRPHQSDEVRRADFGAKQVGQDKVRASEGGIDQILQPRGAERGSLEALLLEQCNDGRAMALVAIEHQNALCHYGTRCDERARSGRVRAAGRKAASEPISVTTSIRERAPYGDGAAPAEIESRYNQY
jgi:hypothetical protein